MGSLYLRKMFYLGMNNLKKNINKNREGFLRVLLLVFIIMVYILLDVECLFISIFDRPCLGCGMTRAWISLLEGDFYQAYEYHKAFWTVPIIFIYIFKGKLLFKRHFWDIMLLVLLIAMFIINYIY